jgi:hypothetical protein
VGLAALAIGFRPSLPHPPAWLNSLIPGMTKSHTEPNGDNDPNHWSRYQFSDASFSLQLPDVPKRDEDTSIQEVTRGEAEKVILSICKQEGVMYQVVVTQLTTYGRDVQWSKDPSKWRDDIRNEVLGIRPGSQVMSERPLEFSDLVGMEITTQEAVDDKTVHVRNRGYRFPNHSVFLIVSSTNAEDLNAVGAETFFSSLKLDAPNESSSAVTTQEVPGVQETSAVNEDSTVSKAPAAAPPVPDSRERSRVRGRR